MPAHAIYSLEQRDALTLAYDDPAHTASDVAALAAAGELEHKGKRLRPFKIDPRAVRSVASRVRRLRSPPEIERATQLLGQALMKIGLEEVRELQRQKKGERDLQRYKELTVAYARIADIARSVAARPLPAPQASEQPEAAGEPGGTLLQAMRVLERPILPAQRAPLAPVPNEADPDDQAVA